MTVPAQFRRKRSETTNDYPQTNMFDQPEFESLLRSNLKHYVHTVLRGDSKMTDVVHVGIGRLQVLLRRMRRRGLIRFCSRQVCISLLGH